MSSTIGMQDNPLYETMYADYGHKPDSIEKPSRSLYAQPSIDNIDTKLELDRQSQNHEKLVTLGYMNLEMEDSKHEGLYSTPLN